MTSEEVIINKQIVFGVKKRMNNQEAPQKIGELWAAFLAKQEQPFPYYSIYTNYESNYTGAYDYYLGTATYDKHKETCVIPAGKYLKIPVVPNNIEGVSKTWQKIWEQDNELPRTYQVDFEKYEQNGQITIYLSI